MRRLQQATLVMIVFVTSTSFYTKKYTKATRYLVCDKSDYSLTVFDEDGWLVKYPVVFGSDDLGDKLYEGDRRTPEGVFKITNKRVHEKWCRYMGLDYPTKDSYTKFNQRKANGSIPQNARIGGSIGIHGTWPHEEYAVDQYKNWTLGCISMKNEDVKELYSMMPAGTTIVIQK